MTFPLPPDLRDAVADLRGSGLTAPAFTTALTAAFHDSTVYAVRLPGRPRLAAYRLDGAVWAPVFSALTELARWCARRPEPEFAPTEVAWYALTGADLLTLLPAGCGFVIDPGSANALSYPASALSYPATALHPETAGIVQPDQSRP